MNTPRKVAVYRLTVDHGLAPNPFHGVCTLAVCTPNHKRSNLNTGDIIIGVTGDRIIKEHSLEDVRIIYCMQVEEVLDLDTYFHHPAYQDKKPNLARGGIYEKGDNFYFRDGNGCLVHSRETDEHCGEGIESQDAYGDRVFISKNYLYFGRSAIHIPLENEWGKKLYEKVSKHLTQGVHYIYGGSGIIRWDQSDINLFLEWFEKYPQRGLVDMPFHF